MHDSLDENARFPSHRPPVRSRRDFLVRCGAGFGALPLVALLSEGGWAFDGNTANPSPLALKPAHFAPRAKHVIFLFMDGGPSQLDTFDPKPKVNELAGQPLPPSIKRPITPMGVSNNALLASRRTFRPAGRSGIPVSDWLPHIATCADDLTVIRSCWADGLNHVGSVCQMNTGSVLAGRPSLGSWVTYGLGTENQNLPSFVVLTDGEREPPGGARNWGTGFMPGTYQGTRFRNGAQPVLSLQPPARVAPEQQRRKLELLSEINRQHALARGDDPELEARIASYELAYRMQAEAPEAIDLAAETAETRRLYGLDSAPTANMARSCLMARRLVERGVRFVQIYCGSGSRWDAHSKIEQNHSELCRASDQPIAGLIQDLKRRGLLAETLVIWGGEFGRTPMSEKGDGRDHNPYGFSMWMAGAGLAGGRTIGATDEMGLFAIQDRIHVHDLHATILALLGLDHKRLTWLHNGRDERATINGGELIPRIYPG
ncbi:MAG: DUF1501 domain-containing protein [Planctomycetia bacterium]|nr:DUF1501 domain-containing protein [Planctomycetia bacterium]